MEQETKGIRYQSEHFPTVQGLTHCVNEQSLMEEHRKHDTRGRSLCAENTGENDII